MASELICPDCGGVIGARTATAAGGPCTCFGGGGDGDSLSGTGTEMAGALGAGVEKVCVVCGENVAGRKRYKDSRGYVCAACHKKEKVAEAGPQVVCSACMKTFGLGQTVPDQSGGRICQRCEVKQTLGEGTRRDKVTAALAQDREKKLIRLQIAIGAAAVVVIYLAVEFGLLKLPGARTDAGDATMLLEGARVVGLVFLALFVAAIWWIKRTL